MTTYSFDGLLTLFSYDANTDTEQFVEVSSDTFNFVTETSNNSFSYSISDSEIDGENTYTYIDIDGIGEPFYLSDSTGGVSLADVAYVDTEIGTIHWGNNKETTFIAIYFGWYDAEDDLYYYASVILPIAGDTLPNIESLDDFAAFTVKVDNVDNDFPTGFQEGDNIAISSIPGASISENDVAQGSYFDDDIDLGAGKDVFDAREGDDTVRGGNGSDTLKGGDGSDKIYGDGGNDTIKSGDDGDKVWGGKGKDTVSLGEGDDVFIDHKQSGDKGSDTVKAGKGDDIIKGKGGNDKFLGEAGADTIEGGAGDDKIHGGNGFDEISGGSGNDEIKGGGGIDQLFGDEGDDAIYGNAGKDFIDGGEGDDLLFGGVGADTFHFTDGTEQTDTIGDFDTSRDSIQIDTSETSASVNITAGDAIVTVGDLTIVLEGITDQTAVEDALAFI